MITGTLSISGYNYFSSISADSIVNVIETTMESYSIDVLFTLSTSELNINDSKFSDIESKSGFII
jgi:hypothetical protein